MSDGWRPVAPRPDGRPAPPAAPDAGRADERPDANPHAAGPDGDPAVPSPARPGGSASPPPPAPPGAATVVGPPGEAAPDEPFRIYRDQAEPRRAVSHRPREVHEPGSQPTPRRMPSAAQPSRTPRAPLPRGGYANERFAPPVDAAPPPHRRTRRPWLIAIAGLVAVAVAVAMIMVFLRPRPTTDPGVSVSQSATLKLASADELVRRYFTAIAAGRAEEALGYGPAGPGDRALLTDAALRTAQKALPIQDIDVEPSGQNATSVAVSYTAGSQRVTTQVPVRRQADGAWRLDHATVSVSISAKRSSGVPVIINGRKVDANLLEVFPGGYAIATGLPFVEYAPGAGFSVSRLDATPEVTQLATRLTGEGERALRTAAEASLARCLEQRSLAPPNCPFATTSAEPIDPNSIRWSLRNRPFDAFKPRIVAGTPTGEAVLEVAASVFAAFSRGGSSTTDLTFTATLNADMSVASPDRIDVRWRI